MAFMILADHRKFWGLLPEPETFSLIGTLVGAFPIFQEAFSNLIARRMTMELSMAIAVVAALTIGEHQSALVIAFFVLIAEILEHMTMDRGRNAIRDLLAYLPAEAAVKENGEVRLKPIGQLRIGDIVVIKPGERISVDGEVIGGNSFVDQSAITGESMPAAKSLRSKVFAGTINQSGALEVRTDRVGRETAFGKIVEAVEKAEHSRAPVQKIADRLARNLVYFAFLCAGITFLFSHNLRDTISVIIVAGACGVAAGTPLAILGAIGQAARQGAIVKGGLYLETLGKIDTVVIDKTGTLTFGHPEVTEVSPVAGVSEADVLRVAAAAEVFSEHPIGKAVTRKAADRSIPASEPQKFNYIPGKGIVCLLDGQEIIVGKESFLKEKKVDFSGLPVAEGTGSLIFVARSKKLLGRMLIRDELRPQSRAAISLLKKMGIEPVLLSGDSQQITQEVGKLLGISRVSGELLPDDKLRRINDLILDNHCVAMIGDGINDAPALSASSIGVAMGSGTDVARESADVLLIGNDLLKFVDVLKLSRRCHAIIMFNFIGTLTVDGVGVVLAALGFLNPMMAAFIHVSSELVFILNSARLLSTASFKIKRAQH